MQKKSDLFKAYESAIMSAAMLDVLNKFYRDHILLTVFQERSERDRNFNKSQAIMRNLVRQTYQEFAILHSVDNETMFEIHKKWAMKIARRGYSMGRTAQDVQYIFDRLCRIVKPLSRIKKQRNPLSILLC